MPMKILEKNPRTFRLEYPWKKYLKKSRIMILKDFTKIQNYAWKKIHVLLDWKILGKNI